MIKTLHCIKEIAPEDCYKTYGSRPVKVMCDDLDYYVCKYHCGKGFPFTLFNELIAGTFLNLWRLPVPEFSVVKIDVSHVTELEIPYHCFEKSCFGSKFIGTYKEVDKFFLKMSFINPENQTGRVTFLKTALFDIWLCNEDRHWDNFNLLYNMKTGQFVPIDHVNCFNGVNLGKEPALISPNESLLAAPLLSRFFSRSLQRKANELRLTVLHNFRNHVQQCHDQLDNILASIPLDWDPDLQQLRSDLGIYFSPQWIKSCENHFTELFHQHIKKQ